MGETIGRIGGRVVIHFRRLRSFSDMSPDIRDNFSWAMNASGALGTKIGFQSMKNLTKRTPSANA